MPHDAALKSVWRAASYQSLVVLRLSSSLSWIRRRRSTVTLASNGKVCKNETHLGVFTHIDQVFIKSVAQVRYPDNGYIRSDEWSIIAICQDPRVWCKLVYIITQPHILLRMSPRSKCMPGKACNSNNTEENIILCSHF